MKYQITLSVALATVSLVFFQNCGQKFESSEETMKIVTDSSFENLEQPELTTAGSAIDNLLNGPIVRTNQGYSIREGATCEEIKRSLYYRTAVGLFAETAQKLDKFSIQAESLKSLDQNLILVDRGALQMGKINNSTAQGRRQLKRLIKYDVNFAETNFPTWFEICSKDGSTRPFPELLAQCGLSSPTCKSIGDLNKKVISAKQYEKTNYGILLAKGCL